MNYLKKCNNTIPIGKHMFVGRVFYKQNLVYKFVCLFTYFVCNDVLCPRHQSLMLGHFLVFHGSTSTKQSAKCPHQGHNTVALQSGESLTSGP